MVGVTDQERAWFANAQKDYEVASNDQKTQEATEDIIKEGGNQKEILDTVKERVEVSEAITGGIWGWGGEGGHCCLFR